MVWYDENKLFVLSSHEQVWKNDKEFKPGDTIPNMKHRGGNIIGLFFINEGRMNGVMN